MTMLFAATRQSLASLSTATIMRPSGPTVRRHLASLAHRRHRKNFQLTKLRNKLPSTSYAMEMPLTLCEYNNESLMTLVALDDHHACSEMLVRHIMATDKTDYQSALKRYEDVETYHKPLMSKYLIPYQVGIATAITAGLASIPLCFHLDSVTWFNTNFVTADVPEPKDLETWLEVGSWSWNWMEPPLGQISFFLLCMEYTRAQMENLGIRPYARKVKLWRAQQLVEAYPMYDDRILTQWSSSAKLWL